MHKHQKRRRITRGTRITLLDGKDWQVQAAVVLAQPFPFLRTRLTNRTPAREVRHQLLAQRNRIVHLLPTYIELIPIRRPRIPNPSRSALLVDSQSRPGDGAEMQLCQDRQAQQEARHQRGIRTTIHRENLVFIRGRMQHLDRPISARYTWIEVRLRDRGFSEDLTCASSILVIERCFVAAIGPLRDRQEKRVPIFSLPCYRWKQWDP